MNEEIENLKGLLNDLLERKQEKFKLMQEMYRDNIKSFTISIEDFQYEVDKITYELKCIERNHEEFIDQETELIEKLNKCDSVDSIQELEKEVKYFKRHSEYTL